MREDTDPTTATVAVSFEAEVHFLDAAALRRHTKLGLGASGSSAEENAVLWVHGTISPARVLTHPSRRVNRSDPRAASITGVAGSPPGDAWCRQCAE